jgi:hypothetical protein
VDVTGSSPVSPIPFREPPLKQGGFHFPAFQARRYAGRKGGSNHCRVLLDKVPDTFSAFSAPNYRGALLLPMQ